MKKLDRLICIVRSLKEEGTTLASGQIEGTVESGDDPPVHFKKKIGKKPNSDNLFKNIRK